MTRFARARGSKSSNERIPEEATSWHVMRQQLQEKQNVPSKDQKKTKRAKEYMQFEVSDIQKNEWAVFEEHTKPELDSNDGRKHKNFVSLKTDREISKPEENYSIKKDKLHTIANKSSRVQKEDTRTKCAKEIKMVFPGVHMSDVEHLNKEAESQGTHPKRQKMEGKKKRKGLKKNSFTETTVKDLEEKDSEDKHEIAESREGRKQNERKVERQSDAESPVREIGKRNTNRKNVFEQNRSGSYKRKLDGKRNKDNPYKRRKPETPTTTMFLNGKEIEVMPFDGFPVKKEDAERLTELRQQLLAKGIPTQEVLATIKLERRRAEKALTRERKKVCFQCRKSGHLLSECPELGSSNESGMGICFKCGSTEHTHFQCKVTRSQDFRYAVCFICKEQGHISRQCPDNPRGLYPKGGACKVCGDVTHLKKDCPDLIQGKEQQTITLGTLDDNSLEVLDEELKETNHSTGQSLKKKKTVVKF